MSVDAIVYARRIVLAPNGERLTHSEKTVLLILASYLNEATGTAWPSIETLARESTYSTRQVKRSIAGLIAKGVLRRIPSQNESPTPHYVLPALLQRTESDDENAGSDMSRMSRRGDIHDTQGETSEAENVSPMSPNRKDRQLESKDIDPYGTLRSACAADTADSGQEESEPTTPEATGIYANWGNHRDDARAAIAAGKAAFIARHKTSRHREIPGL